MFNLKSDIMFNNYIKSAGRFLMQNKVFASINALGLSIALATSFIILLFVINELSYDNFHENKKQVFRVLNYYIKFDRTITSTPYILSTALKKEFPQVQKAIRVAGFLDFKLKLNNEIIDIPETVATDPDVFEIFTIKLVMSPSAQDSFDDKNTLILSRKMANRIFPNKNPIGKEIIGLVNGEEHIFIIKNIFEDIPENSTFRAQCLISSRWTIESINKISKITDADVSWDQDFCTTWLLLSKDCNINALQQQFEAFEKKYINESPQKHYSLQNLSDVYLGSDDVLYSKIKGNINNIKLFSIIAFLIVLVAALNYIILSTAVSTGRAKEIGIRKTSGAENKSIRNQLLSESILLCLIVLPISLVIMFLALPFAGKLFQTNLNIISSNLIIYISVYLSLALLIGFASGIYTSYFLSRLKVIDIFKNTLYLGKRRQIFRATLIIIQLVIFCSFVSSTLIIRSQYKYAIRADAGYYILIPFINVTT
jgi:putative ABC transport system permease protein